MNTLSAPNLRTVAGRLLVWLALVLAFSPHAACGQTLLAHYPMNGDFRDVGGSNHGTPTGISYGVDRNGTPGSAGQFNGMSSYADVGTGLKPAFPITVTSWVKGYGIVLANDRVDHTASRFGFSLYWSSTNSEDRAATFFSGSAGRASRQSRGPDGLDDLDPLAWHHITVVMHSVTNTQWFVDGRVYGDKQVNDGTGTTMRYSSDGHGTVGTSLPASSGFYKGSIDELRLYSGALTLDQVSRLPEYDQLPRILKAPVSTNVVIGSRAQFSVETSSPALQYQWYRLVNNVEQLLPGETRDALVIEPAIPFFQGQYLVKLSNSWGNVSSAPVRLHVSQIIPEVRDLLSLSFPTSNGKLYHIESSPALSSPVWTAETNETIGSGQLARAELTPTGLIQYYRIRESEGSMPTGRVCVASAGPAIEFLESPSNQTIRVEGTAIMSVTVSGAEPVSFQWWGPGGELSDDPSFFSGSRTCTLTVQNALNLFTGDYWVVASNSSSTNVSSLARLTVVSFRATETLGSRITFAATEGHVYQIEYSANLDESAWLAWGEPVSAVLPEVTVDYLNNHLGHLAFRVTDITP